MHQLKQDILRDFPALGLTPDTFILSMGTSADFEEAIVHGANEVRVGTILFGQRDYPAKKNPEEDAKQ
jgi:PLP dependent protein